MWLVVLSGLIAGILQSSLVGLWAEKAWLNLPVLAIMAAMRYSPPLGIFLTAIAAGLGYDFIDKNFGPTALILLIATGLVIYIEGRVLPARGGIAIGSLTAIMVIVMRLGILIISGNISQTNLLWWAVIEALITGFVAAMFWHYPRKA
jgi:hypothetical protein